jgi:RNA 2',3'-cyclic 3'-phosphodiesterase
MKRVFLAVQVPDAARIATSEHISALRLDFPDARISWVRTENLHITIKFLGKVEADCIEIIKNIALAAASSIRPFKIRFGVPGSFGEKVLYISLTDEASGLTHLHRNLEIGLEKAGFQKEKRPFRSHLTIGRVRSDKGIKPLIQRHRSASVESVEFEVAELVLFESIMSVSGSEYRKLATFPLLSQPTT